MSFILQLSISVHIQTKTADEDPGVTYTDNRYDINIVRVNPFVTDRESSLIVVSTHSVVGQQP